MKFPTLEPYAKALAELSQLVASADDAELARLEKECAKTTKTNCWWATYQVARIIEPWAASEKRMRAENKREERR